MTVEFGARGASRGAPAPRQRFATATKQLGNGTPVVSVAGELDLATAPAFERRLLDATESEMGEVIVDLTACSVLDSTGLRALIGGRSASSARTDRSRLSFRARS